MSHKEATARIKINKLLEAGAGDFSRPATHPPTFASNPALRSSPPIWTPSATTSRRARQASSIFSCSMPRASRCSSSKPRPRTKIHSSAKNRRVNTLGPRTAASSSYPTATCTISGISNAAAPTSSLPFRHPNRSPATGRSPLIRGA